MFFIFLSSWIISIIKILPYDSSGSQTIAAAKLVPLFEVKPTRFPPSTGATGGNGSHSPTHVSLAPAATIYSPGAIISGLVLESIVGPRLENPDTNSNPFMSSVISNSDSPDPTVITFFALAGSLINFPASILSSCASFGS